MKKKFLVSFGLLLVAGLAAFGFSACEKKSEKETKTTENTETTTTGGLTAETQASTEEVVDLEEDTDDGSTDPVVADGVSGTYNKEGGDAQFTIQGDDGVFTVKGDGVDGDKYGEIDGILLEQEDGSYQYTDSESDGKVIFLPGESGTMVVSQEGKIGSQGFSFAGTYVISEN